MEQKKLRSGTVGDGVLLLGLLLAGGFHEYISCLLGGMLSICLLVRLAKAGALRVRTDLLTAAVAVLCLGYGITCLWAVDKGMAPVGFLKFLPVLLYLLYLQQESTGRVLEVLPSFGAAMAVLSAIGMLLPLGKQWFSVAGRLAGFFQYPNTFAIFLLVCQLLLLKKQEKKLWDWLTLFVLVAGLLYTGSRTAFVVAVLANLAMVLALGGRKQRIGLLIGCGAAAVAVAAVLVLTKDTVLHRYLNISLTESTFVGRLLYWQDSLKLLLKYPFGMGYMGYYYAQQEIQTGVYTVLYVHNDFLQLTLDTGLLPGGLFLGAVIAWFCKKEVPVQDKIIAGALCLHSLFDFNLQFTAVFFLLILLLQTPGKTREFACKKQLPWKLAAGVLAAVSLYMAVPLALAHWEMREPSEALYPYNTQNKLVLLERAADYDTALPLAEQILQLNKSFHAPYSVRAGDCYRKGNFADMIRNQREAIKRSPFNTAEYENYCKMLINGIDRYQKDGNEKAAVACAQELLSVAAQLHAGGHRLSTLGKMIKDQPVTKLSSQVEEYITRLEEAVRNENK